MRSILKEVVFLLKAIVILLIVGLLGYTLVGTDGNITELKKRVPLEVEQRNWKILRYDGFEYGSWYKHGGSVWYHVCNIDNPNIQYRVNVSIWDGELQFYYGQPEILNRLELNSFK